MRILISPTLVTLELSPRVNTAMHLCGTRTAQSPFVNRFSNLREGHDANLPSSIRFQKTTNPLHHHLLWWKTLEPFNFLGGVGGLCPALKWNKNFIAITKESQRCMCIWVLLIKLCCHKGLLQIMTPVTVWFVTASACSKGKLECKINPALAAVSPPLKPNTNPE